MILSKARIGLVLFKDVGDAGIWVSTGKRVLLIQQAEMDGQQLLWGEFKDKFSVGDLLGV